MKFILAKKIEMTQRFREDGKVNPVTIVEAGPCTISQTKDNEKEGYAAVQIGFGEKKTVGKSLAGHLKKLMNLRYLREFRVDEIGSLKRGQIITTETFEVGDIVEVIGTSKGKGFQGVVKRHGFKGGRGSHGDKDQLRMPGSIGATDAARVFKGKRMGGHMGDDRVTIKNLEVIEIDAEKNHIYLKGAVPGARGSLIHIIAPGELKITDKKTKEDKPKEVKENTKEIKDEKKVDEKPKTEIVKEKKSTKE